MSTFSGLQQAFAQAGYIYDVGARLSAIQKDQQEREARKAEKTQLAADYKAYMDTQKQNEFVMNNLLAQNKQRAAEAERQRKEQIRELKAAQKEADRLAREESQRIAREEREKARAERERARQQERDAREMARVERQYAIESIREQRIAAKEQKMQDDYNFREEMRERFDMAGENKDDIEAMKSQINQLSAELIQLRNELYHREQPSVLNYTPQ